MVRKIKQYYQIFGFKETIKKVIRYLVFKNKIRFNNNGCYRISKKEYKVAFFKKNTIYIMTSTLYENLDDNAKSVLQKLNDIGYKIVYYYTNGKNKKVIKPISEYKSLQKVKSYNINKNDILIVLDDFLVNNDLINTHAGNKIIKANSIDEKIIAEVRKYSTTELDRFYNNIAIIVLNHNNMGIIGKCIDSLIKHNKRYHYEIIVVDNASNDGSFEMLKKYDGIRLFRNKKNGCSSGRNIGIQNTEKEYIMFLDSDQFVIDDYWLDNYLDILNDNDNIGAVGWAAGWFNKKGYAYHTVDNFEFRYMPPMFLYRKDIGYLGTGGMLTTRQLLNNIGGFDETYDPTCYEDTDLSLKIRDYGKEIVYSPYLGLIHEPHQTTKSGGDAHSKLILEKGNYFKEKWKDKKELLKYTK